MKLKDRDFSQIVRFDGLGCFFEAMNYGFPIDKLVLRFVSYDKTRHVGSRQTARVDYYLSINECLMLCHQIKSGELQKKAQASISDKASGNKQYLEPAFISMGGSFVDGKAVSRQLKIMPGERKPFLISAEAARAKEALQGSLSPGI